VEAKMDWIWEPPKEDLFGQVIDARIEEFESTFPETEGELVQRLVIDVSDLLHPEAEVIQSFRFNLTKARSRRSKFARFKTDLEKIGFKVQTTSDLVNRWAHFKIKTRTLGLERGGTEEYPQPIRFFESEEELRAYAADQGIQLPSGEIPGFEKPEIDPAALKLVDVLDGKTLAEAMGAVVAAPELGVFTADLLGEKKTIQALMQANKLSQTPDERYHKV